MRISALGDGGGGAGFEEKKVSDSVKFACSSENRELNACSGRLINNASPIISLITRLCIRCMSNSTPEI